VTTTPTPPVDVEALTVEEALKYDERIWRAFLVLKPVHRAGLLLALSKAVNAEALSELTRLRAEVAEAKAEASHNYTISVRLTKERDDARSGWDAARASCEREVRVRHEAERQLHADVALLTATVEQVTAENERVKTALDYLMWTVDGYDDTKDWALRVASGEATSDGRSVLTATTAKEPK
jgi:hypothetical protein